MRRNKLSLSLHLVWATWDRLPMITPDVERRLYREIESEAITMRCIVLALNGMPDHVHVSMRAPTDTTPREMADGLRRALNLAAGCALFSPRMYAGTFSDYPLSLIRQRR